MLLRIARENEPRLRIDEAANQPRGAHAIDLRAGPREPGAPEKTLGRKRGGRAGLLRVQGPRPLELHPRLLRLRRIEIIERADFLEARREALQIDRETFARLPAIRRDHRFDFSDES